MNIAVIGAGSVGEAIANAAVRAGHTVTVTASNPANAEKVASNTGARSSSSNSEAAETAEIIVLAVPHGVVGAVVQEVGNALSGKTIIDATNPLNADYSGLTTSTRSAAEGLQDKIPDASVVKAFNTVFASNQADPKVDGVQLDGLFAGDDEAAKQKVAQLLDSLGYRPIDAGPLRMARALEEMAFLNISLNARNGWSWQSGWKLVGPSS